MTRKESGWTKELVGGWNALSLIAAVLLVLALQLATNLYRPAKGAIALGEAISVGVDGIDLGGGRVPLLFSSGKAPDFKPGVYRFVMEFPAGEKVRQSGDLVLVVPQIAGSSLEARLNGVLLGVKGDPVLGRSSIWNAVHVLPIGPGVLSQDNRLELDILGTYEAGVILKPYIEDTSASFGVFFLLMISNYLLWIAIGALFAVSLIIFSMGVFGGTEQSTSIFLGVAGVFAAIVLLDFAYIERLPCSLAVFKRLVVCARHLSAGIFILAYTKILRKRQDIFSIGFAGLQAACFLLVLLYPGTIVDIKRLYGWTYLVFIPFQAYLACLILFSGRVDRAFHVLAFGVAVAFFGAFRDIVCMVIIKDPGALMISQYGFIVLALCSSIFVIDDSIVHYRDLVAERRRAASLREESVRDALTDAYNRKILPVIAEDLGRPYAVLVIDLDGLKMVNDEYGHATGDAVLVDLVRLLKRNIRFDDLIVRMGGDEFVIVLRACPSNIAFEIAERLETDCAKAAVPVVASGESRPEALGNLSYSVSIGVALGEGEGGIDLEGLASTIAEADRKMYKAKQSGKGCVIRE
jgi:diguanylate cyclase